MAMVIRIVMIRDLVKVEDEERRNNIEVLCIYGKEKDRCWVELSVLIGVTCRELAHEGINV